ncbi:cell division protein FtsK [Streptodolium elevatio]|uniref:Cell division protein FtsK n=1 Tax=Streptodolium elevatio TaxID=3157996 RepID=A0ABV3DGQ4_9ACTN
MTDTELFGPDLGTAPGDVEGHRADVIPLRKPVPADTDTDTDPAPADVDDGPAVPVDAPALRRPSWRTMVQGEKRRPIFPAWLLSRDALKAQVRWVLSHTGHVFAFHAVRTPVYAATLAVRSPQGALRLVSGAFRWASDADGRPVRAKAIERADAGEYLRLQRQRDGRVKLRATILATATLTVGILLTALILVGPAWGLALTLMGVTAGLGFLGAPEDKPIVAPAVVRAQVQRLTSLIVLRALSSLGIAALNSKDAHINFPAPITRDGPGWRADVELPYGVTVNEVMDKRDKLASGLRRPLGCVWPEKVTGEHPGLMTLWVGDKDMAGAEQPKWPLDKTGSVSLFKAAPFGTDQRGRMVGLTMMFVSVIIGAVPRMGKTFLLRLLLLIAALDVLAEIHAHELKGTGDLSPLEPVAHRYSSGEEDEDIEYGIADMRDMRAELRRRAKVIRGLPRDLCPENKVTPELAAKRSLGLHPIVIAVDECQVWFEHAKYGAEFEEICTDLVKRGPALGIILILATQRPDAKSLPTGISANAIVRMCMKVMDHTANDMVLGTSAHKNGIRATMFSREDRGIMYFVGEGADARIVRSFYKDAIAAERIALRARGMREAAGTLSGYALDKTDTPVAAAPAHDLLADVLAVMHGDEAKLWNETVVDRLAALRPDAYGPWATLDAKSKPAQLTAALKPFGVKTKGVWLATDDGGGSPNRVGITRSDITTAITKRDGRAASD